MKSHACTDQTTNVWRFPEDAERIRESIVVMGIVVMGIVAP